MDGLVIINHTRSDGWANNSTWVYNMSFTVYVVCVPVCEMYVSEPLYMLRISTCSYMYMYMYV